MAVFNIILATILLVFFSAPISHADVVDRVVAVVNNDVITLSEVNQEGKALLQRVAENVSPEELPDALKEARKTIIGNLIDKKIMMQEAEKERVSVSDEEVDRAYIRVIEQNGLTEEKFKEQLAAVGMNETLYRENLKVQILSSKLVNLQVRSKVIIPENKIIDYYDTHYTERISEGGFYLLQIGLGWDEKGGITKEIARKKAEDVRNLALKGKDFRELAREHSTLPSAIDGGDIGVLQDDDMSPEMIETISATGAGEISPVIETASEYQFFKVLSSQDGQIITKVPYESVKDEIYDTLYQQEMESRYKKWLKEIKSQAYIKIY